MSYKKQKNLNNTNLNIKDWFIEAFSYWYKIVYSHRDEKEAQKQVKFLTSIIPISKSSKILDLCCGYGRHIKFLTKLSYYVIGLDLSKELLIEAQKYIGNSASLICGDVRFLPFKEKSFDIILSLFTSFGYFSSDEENFLYLKNSSHVLKNNGYLILDYLNPQKVKISKKHSTTKLIKNLVLHETKWFDKKLSRINKEITIKNKSGSLLKSYIESVKVYDLSQIKQMLTKCNINIINLFGDYSFTEFNDESPRLIVIGKKHDEK